MKTVRQICLVLLPFVLMGCFASSEPDPEPVLTPITNEGKGTFSCKVNGKVFVPNEVIMGPNVFSPGTPILVEYYYGAFHFNVGNKEFGLLSFETIPVTDTGEVAIATFAMQSMGYLYLVPGTGHVHLTAYRKPLRAGDTAVKIVAGTFEAQVHNKKGDTVVISEGRFDWLYN